ncbi:MAG: endonuclease domain-containing protein [Bacteroidetes bacterium]|nr:MAG: endonuclease domain-containing protein [Bacteroidota bacterium]
MNAYKRVLSFAREMRKNPTPAEKYFWGKVRNRQLDGKKFNRQFIMQHDEVMDVPHFFIADFYCHEHRLVVELDGGIHKQQADYDKIREEVLKEMGFSIIRFPNELVLGDWPTVERRLRSCWL